MKRNSTSQPTPLRRSPGEGGFFNLRVLIGLFVSLAGVFLALLGFGAFSIASAQPNTVPDGPRAGRLEVIRAVHSDLSLPLRDQPVVWPPAREKREPHGNPRLPIRHHDRPDPVIQSSFAQQLTTSVAIPPPIRQWAGMGHDCKPPLFMCSVPPDTNGAVGKTQYVQMVNVALQVFDKVTGTSLLNPTPIRSVWSGFGGACEDSTSGDPIVLYDRLADRWVISQFATPEGAEDDQDECIAVSQTDDATGAWYRYDFHLTFRFQDYPKLGVWPDGYYMSANMFDGKTHLGAKPFVFNRAKMLGGDPSANLQTTQNVVSEDFFLPSDLDGIIPPPAGDPNHFVAVTIAAKVEEAPAPPRGQKNAPSPRAVQSTAPPFYKVWNFHVDWNNPANSSFTLRANVPAADFTVLTCVDEKGELTGDCVPQLGIPDPLSGLVDRLMFRNAYRRFPDGRESLLNNFTVKADSVAGIRWFELQRRSPGGWMLRQQSTYQPDSTWRWMGSIASDNTGNIALGFSASSATIHPQIRYAGRLATDPLGILSGEQHLFDGTGSQMDRECDPEEESCFRWGDYSDMTVDSVDDCTFYLLMNTTQRRATHRRRAAQTGRHGSATSGSPSAQRRQKEPGIL